MDFPNPVFTAVRTSDNRNLDLDTTATTAEAQPSAVSAYSRFVHLHREKVRFLGVFHALERFFHEMFPKTPLA